MRAALKLAAKGLGKTSPNPAVGAIVVRGTKILGTGYHRAAGTPHAEIHALDEAGGLARGATLYVTLEPCCHLNKRTPPCVDRIISSGVSRVVIGALDPNPLVSGRGARALRRAGIKVTADVLGQECARLNEAYNKFITTGLPFVTLKLAATLDGKIAAGTGKSRWITGEQARKVVHMMRAESDAVMVGAGTAINDDPELTVRHVNGKDPIRVVLDSKLRVPVSAKVYGKRGGVVVVTSIGARKAGIKALEERGVRVIALKPGKRGLGMKAVFKKLGSIGIMSIVVEGGSDTAARALSEGAVDKVAFFYAPSIMGGDGVPMVGALGIRDPARAPRLKDLSVTRVGEDVLMEGYF